MVYRTVLIILTSLLIVFVFQNNHFVMTPYFLMGILLIQVYSIHRREVSHKEKIIAHLETVLLDETPNAMAKNEKSLYYRMDTVLKEIKTSIIHLNTANQEKADLFNAVLSHINIGLMTYDSEGVIGFINKTARNLCSINYLSNINHSKLFTSQDKKELLDFNTNIKKIILLTNNVSVYTESSAFILHEKPVRILSIQDMEKTLNEKELDSWNILVRTLNHEIMNSITPISSLAASVLSLVGDEQNHDLTEAMKTIDRRSRDLLSFVEKFKTLSQIPKPQRKLLQVNDLINRISLLMSSYVEHSHAALQYDVKDEQLIIFADSGQLEQILINVIKNSLEAGASEILIKAEANTNGDIILLIKDNGSGFSTESEAKACIPFYTTKPEGSGLGLSIVRQIMRLHNGDVKIDSDKNGSQVTLIFS